MRIQKTVLTYFLGLALATGGVLLAGNALAELEKPDGFPDRPVTVIVPFGTGGGSDQFARALAPEMQELMGVPVQVTNRPGGGGRAAIPDFMSAPADGYTILQFSDDVVTLYPSGRMTEHPTRDWTPIGIGNIAFSQIYIRADEERFTDFESFLEYARGQDGGATMANISHEASRERIMLSHFQDEFDVEIRQISYDDPSERYAALVGGHVDSLFEHPGDVSLFLDAGQFRPILTFLRERPDAFSDVPTVTDAGWDYDPSLRIRGMFVRADVPEERVAYLEEVFRRAYESDRFQEFLAQNYLDIVDSYRSRDEAIDLIDDTIDYFTQAYEELGLE